MSEEVWKDIPKHLGAFHGKKAQISDQGRIRYWWVSKNARIRQGRYKYYKPHMNYGSLCVVDGANEHTRVKMLVMETFVGAKPKGHQIAHLNGDPRNCSLQNLAYVPASAAETRPRKRLSAEERERLRTRWASIKKNGLNLSAEKLAEMEGISVRTLYRILRES